MTCTGTIIGVGTFLRGDRVRTIKYNVSEDFAGKPLKSLLKTYEYSSRLIIKLKKSDIGLLRNGEHIKVTDLLNQGDEIEVNIPDSVSDIPAVKMSIDILYEDEDVLVVNKGVGMPVHPTRNHQGDTLANAVAYYLSQKGINTKFRAINRLDRDTSGAVVIALNEYSATKLQRSVSKVYYAIAEGCVKGTGTIDEPIYRVNERSILRAVGDGGVRAVTHFESIFSSDEYSFLKCVLETGRTHQIRVHFSYIGHPLLGDDMYGGSTDRLKHQALHCGKVKFLHPVSGKETVVECPLRDDMLKLKGVKL